MIKYGLIMAYSFSIKTDSRTEYLVEETEKELVEKMYEVTGKWDFTSDVKAIVEIYRGTKSELKIIDFPSNFTSEEKKIKLQCALVEDYYNYSQS